jgi:hypothetical protein
MKMSMKNKLIVILILLTGSHFRVLCQSSNFGVLQDSNLEIQSEDKEGKPFELHTKLCYMFLNLNTGDFMLKTDANSFETGEINLDTTLNSSESQPIIFKSNMNENMFRFVHDDTEGKMYDMKGVLTINGVDILCVAQFDPVTLGNPNDIKNYRMDFRLLVDAKKITINGLEDKLSKQVVFEVNRGKLNITN